MNINCKFIYIMMHKQLEKSNFDLFLNNFLTNPKKMLKVCHNCPKKILK